MRRRRAAELAADIKEFEDEFKKFHDARRKELDDLERPMNRLLTILGLKSMEDLNEEVEKTANGQVLEKWKSLQDVLNSRDRRDRILGTLLSVAVLGGASAATFQWLGAISIFLASNALALLTGGTVLGFGLVMVFGAVIMGGADKENLRGDIKDMFERRRKVYLALMQSRNISRNFEKLVQVLNNIDHRGVGPEGTTKLLEELSNYEDITNDIAVGHVNCTISKVDRELHKRDVARLSWMRDDPLIEIERALSK